MEWSKQVSRSIGLPIQAHEWLYAHLGSRNKNSGPRSARMGLQNIPEVLHPSLIMLIISWTISFPSPEYIIPIWPIMLHSCTALVRRADHRHNILCMAKHIEGSSRRISQNPSYAGRTGLGYIGGKGKGCIGIGKSIYWQKTVESYAYNIWWRLKTFTEGSGSGMLKREDTLALTCSLMYLYGSSMLSILIMDSFLTSTPDPMTSLRVACETLKHQNHIKWSSKCRNRAFR